MFDRVTNIHRGGIRPPHHDVTRARAAAETPAAEIGERLRMERTAEI
jgi:hypothetical protein